MKTKVEILRDTHQCKMKKGEQGYIDGYTRAADGIGYAVVVVGGKIDFVCLTALKVVK